MNLTVWVNPNKFSFNEHIIEGHIIRARAHPNATHFQQALAHNTTNVTTAIVCNLGVCNRGHQCCSMQVVQTSRKTKKSLPKMQPNWTLLTSREEASRSGRTNKTVTIIFQTVSFCGGLSLPKFSGFHL